jgi:two-component system OmpR family response regulator
MNNHDHYSVFLVDDDPMFRRTLEHHLQQKLKHEVKITSFPTGEECLSKLGESPDVVVLDYFLNADFPKAMNGADVLKNIKKERNGPLVIMVSGQDSMDVAVDCMKYGAYDYVVKNESAFLKIQNLVKHALHSISLGNQVKQYNIYLKIIIGLIATVLLIAILIELFFRDILH